MTELTEWAHFLVWFSKRPDAGLMVVVMLAALLLSRSVRRYRDEVVSRLAECEDAHLERDKIQLDLITLVAEQVGANGRAPERRAGIVDFETRADAIIADIRALNNGMIARRAQDRTSREGKLRLRLPFKVQVTP